MYGTFCCGTHIFHHTGETGVFPFQDPEKAKKVGDKNPDKSSSVNEMIQAKNRIGSLRVTFSKLQPIFTMRGQPPKLEVVRFGRNFNMLYPYAS